MALGQFLNDYFRAMVPRQTSEQDQQALMAALFGGTPQDQVNITPRVTAPDPGQQALMNPSAPQVPAQPMAPNMQPMGQGNPQLAQRAAAGAYQGPAAPMMQGPQADQLKALLSKLSPSAAMPLLSGLANNIITPKTPLIAHEGDTFLNPTNFQPLYAAPPKSLTPNEKVTQTQNDYNALDAGSNDILKAMSPSDPSLGFRAPGLSWEQRKGAQADEQLKKNNPNQPFNDDGTPNAAYQNYERTKVDDRNAVIDQRLEDASKIDLTDPGDLSYAKSIANYKVRPPSAGRNPAARKNAIIAAQTINPDYQEAKFDQSAKALRDFGTGKQGDTARSLNVAVSHLETLRELGKAMGNGDINLINAAKQRFSEEFGVPAPTNFDAAKAIVADEVAKSVIGGQNAQSDRETFAASLKRSRSMDQIEGAIGTFQKLLGGQLKGLRGQYERTTGAKDFDETFLTEETRKALEGSESAGPVSGAKPDADGWTTMPNGARVRVKR